MLHTLRPGRVSVCAVLITISLAVLGSFPAPSSGSSVRGSSDLESSLADAVARYEALENRVLAVESASSRAEKRVRRLATRMLALDHKARRAAIELYKSGATTAVESLMDHDLAELAETAEYLESSAQFHVSVFQTLAAERGRLEATLDRLDVAHKAAEDARAEMAEIKADLEQRIEAAKPDPAIAAQASAITDTPAAAPVSTGPYSADWDAIAQCESGGNWHLDSTYDGGLQFHPLTWLSHGGGQYARYAWQASREEQIAIAEKVLASQGPGAWGSCYQE